MDGIWKEDYKMDADTLARIIVDSVDLRMLKRLVKQQFERDHIEQKASQEIEDEFWEEEHRYGYGQ